MYMQIPPVTRTWLTGVVAVTVGARFGLVPLGALLFSLPLILQRLQVWRLLTCFFFLGPLDFSWLVNLYMMCVQLWRQWKKWRRKAGVAAAPFSSTLTLTHNAHTQCTHTHTMHTHTCPSPTLSPPSRPWRALQWALLRGL
jgi:hypothetical protein